MKTMSSIAILAILAILMTTQGCARHDYRMHGGMHGDGTMERMVPEVKQLVEQNVKDPEKAKQVQALVQDIVAEVKKSAQQTRGFHEQLAALNANYNAKPEEFTKILDQLNNSRMESATKILGTRFKIKDLLTAEEWKNLSDAMNKERREREPGRMGGMHGGTMSPSSGY
jgi:erythromycin esterase-like protein